MDPNSTLPPVGVEQSGEAREQGRLATAGRPEENDQLAVLGLEAQPVERLDHVATRVEGDRQVLDQKVVAHPKAVAGSAPVTRRNADTLAMHADRHCNERQHEASIWRDVDGLGEERSHEDRQHLGQDRGRRVTITASRTRLRNSACDEDPRALSTAKSRFRSSAAT